MEQITVEAEKTQSSENKSQKSFQNVCELIQRKSKKKCKNFKNWNDIEDNLLKRLFGIYGNKWKIIGKHFPTRTPYQLCYRLKTLNENEKKEQLIPLEEKQNFDLQENEKKTSENFPTTGELFTEIVENSFFKKLENLQKIFEASQFPTPKENEEVKELELNEKSEESSVKTFPDMKETLSNLGYLLRDINYLSLLNEKNDKEKHFLILQRNTIKTYICLIKKMKKEKKLIC